MRSPHVVALVAVALGCIESVAAQESGPIGRTLTREATRLAEAPERSFQTEDRGPSDARWTKLGRHVGEHVVISTRAHGEIRGTLRAPDAVAIDVEQGRQIVRVAREDVCDIATLESPTLRSARWGTAGALAGLGVGFLFVLGQGLADVPQSGGTFTPGATLATGAMAGFTIGWLAADSHRAQAPQYLYTDYDRTGCR